MTTPIGSYYRGWLVSRARTMEWFIWAVTILLLTLMVNLYQPKQKFIEFYDRAAKQWDAELTRLCCGDSSNLKTKSLSLEHLRRLQIYAAFNNKGISDLKSCFEKLHNSDLYTMSENQKLFKLVFIRQCALQAAALLVSLAICWIHVGEVMSTHSLRLGIIANSCYCLSIAVLLWVWLPPLSLYQQSLLGQAGDVHIRDTFWRLCCDHLPIYDLKTLTVLFPALEGIETHKGKQPENMNLGSLISERRERTLVEHQNTTIEQNALRFEVWKDSFTLIEILWLAPPALISTTLVYLQAKS